MSVHKFTYTRGVRFMDKRRVNELMTDIVDCSVGYTRPEFNLALALTIAAYIVEMHGDDIERALELHISTCATSATTWDAHRGEPLDIGNAFNL
jgi:hypothetical protein